MFNFFKKETSKNTAKDTVKNTILEENIQGIVLKYKKHHASKRVKISIQQNSSVLVTLPKRMSFSRAQEFAHLQFDWIKSNVKDFSPAQNPIEIKRLRKEAKEYLPNRLFELSKIHGFKYGKVSIKNAKTRWGSCSFLNNINLNLNLMRLDKDLIDYVILHELCHTVEKNHSTRFWTLLEEHLPKARELRKRLKKASL